jgi:hypothetical protein
MLINLLFFHSPILLLVVVISPESPHTCIIICPVTYSSTFHISKTVFLLCRGLPDSGRVGFPFTVTTLGAEKRKVNLDEMDVEFSQWICVYFRKTGCICVCMSRACRRSVTFGGRNVTSVNWCWCQTSIKKYEEHVISVSCKNLKSIDIH